MNIKKRIILWLYYHYPWYRVGRLWRWADAKREAWIAAKLNG